MFLQLLSPQDKSDFLPIAELIILCDKPILWDGKKIEKTTSQTNFKNVSLEKNGKEITQIEELKRERVHRVFMESKSEGVQGKGSGFFSSFLQIEIEHELINKIKNYPLQEVEQPAARLEIALEVLRELLKGKKIELPSVPKLQLFELMQVALVDGNISGIKIQLLNEFAQHFKLENYVFTELLERAEVTSREINKTLTIILE